MGAFDVANAVHTHLVVQPQDARLNPPESYFFIQDGLIVSCGVLYALCYLFYMTRSYRDKTIAGPLEYTCGSMAYEVFYAFVTTSTRFEFWAFLTWFLLDFTGTVFATFTVVPKGQRLSSMYRSIVGFVLCLGVLRALTAIFPDEREQLTAYWTGILLQFPVGWFSVWLLLSRRNTKGHSLEIWITRYLGCFTAYGVFIWRYVNNPDAWGYVASAWSVWIIALTLLPETFYPFIYLWVYKQEDAERRKVKLEEKTQ